MGAGFPRRSCSGHCAMPATRLPSNAGLWGHALHIRMVRKLLRHTFYRPKTSLRNVIAFFQLSARAVWFP